MRNNTTAPISTLTELRDNARLLLQRMKEAPGAEEKRKLATRAFRFAQQAELVAEQLRRDEE